MQAQVDAFTGQNELLQNRIDELQGQVNALTLQNGALQGQVASLTNQNATLQGQVSTLTQQNAALTNTVESLAHTLLGLPADAGVVALLRERTRAEIDRAIAQVGAADRRVRRAERHFGMAVAAQEAGTFRTAVRQFRAAFTIAHAILN